MSKQAAEIVQLHPMSLSRLECTKCGATTGPICNCGSDYRYVPAGKRAAEAVAANPEKSDRMIADETGVNHSTVSRARRRQATGANAPVEKRVGKDGKVRSRAGAKIAVPNGYTSLGEATAVAIGHERNGVAAKEAANRVGFGHQTYLGMRDIVLLNNRSDLSPDDAKTVQDALSDLDTNRQSGRPAKAIKAIALKIWGRKGSRFKSEAKRLEAFLSSVSMVLTVCTSASEIPIPYIGEEQQEKAAADLNEATAALGQLLKRVRKGG